MGQSFGSKTGSFLLQGTHLSDPLIMSMVVIISGEGPKMDICWEMSFLRKNDRLQVQILEMDLGTRMSSGVQK